MTKNPISIESRDPDRKSGTCRCPPAVRGVLSGWANSWLDRQDPRREAAERRARRYLDRMHLLQRIIRSSAESQDAAALLEAVAANLEQRLPASFCGFWRLEEGGERLRLDRLGPAARQLRAGLGFPAELEQPAAAELAECLGGQVVYAPDAREAGTPALLAALARLGLPSVVMAPMQTGGEAFGLVVVARGAANGFTRGECDFLGQVSQSVALAAFQADLHRELESAYRQLRESQHAASERDRLRALGEMASGIAHDINNSISPAALHLETLLERDSALAAETREKLTVVRRAVLEVARTISRMQELSHREAEDGEVRDPLQLNPLVAQVLEGTRPRWRDEARERGGVIEVVSRLDAGLAAVIGNAGEIREALTQLIWNAVDAMPAGGVLTLRTFNQEEPGPPGGRHRRVVVEVGDSGAGMDEETRRRCLDPFFTTKGRRGSGLGLPRVFEIAERHGARLEIDSKPHQGTRMRLLFPAASGEISGVVPRPLPLAPALRVLLIDDDAGLLETLQEVFTGDGHQVEIAAGGRAGIEAFGRAWGEGRPFGLVVTDLGMPEVDGRQVAATLRELAPATKIILLTGWGHRILWKGEKMPDFDLILPKPPRLKDLRQAVLRLAG